MTTTRARVLRWERRPDERPQELLEAALRVFAERGYRTTRLEEVAEAAGVTKGTIYHYFTSKEELLLRAVEHYQERALGRVEEALRSEQGPASARIRLLLRKTFGGADPLGRHVLTLLVHGTLREVPSLYQRWLTAGPVRGWRLLAALVEEGIAAGEFRRDVDVEVAARVLISGLMLQIIWQRQADAVPALAIDEDRLIDSAVEQFLSGLRPVAPTVPPAVGGGEGQGPRRGAAARGSGI